jgi:hypothetical protein
MKKEMNIFHDKGHEQMFAIDMADIHLAAQHFN